LNRYGKTFILLLHGSVLYPISPLWCAQPCSYASSR
jgi:hypothetical protein